MAWCGPSERSNPEGPTEIALTDRREPEGIRTLKETFDYALNRPRAWRDTARNLLRAAEIIARACDLGFSQELTDANVARAEHTARLLGPLLLLRASAVECILKAHYVRNGGVLAKEGRYVGPRRLKGHDLRELARASKQTLSSDEAVVVAALSDWITRGRYPLQLTWDQHFFGRFATAAPWSRRREAAYTGLVARLDAALDE